MNKLKGIIRGITSDEYISMLEIAVDNKLLAAIHTQTEGADAIQIGDEVMVSFKETAMSVAKHLSGELSIQNRFDLIIESVAMDKVLAKILLVDGKHHFAAVITTSSAKRMQLTSGDMVEGLVKTTDLIITKV